MSTENPPYYQIDEVKENLEEEDRAPNEDRLQNWGLWVDNKINDKIRYIFPDTAFVKNLKESDFTDAGFTKQDFRSMQLLATAGVEAKFWKETNDNDKALESWKEELEQWVKDLTQVPATTLV